MLCAIGRIVVFLLMLLIFPPLLLFAVVLLPVLALSGGVVHFRRW